ncbi:MAG: OsmC family protein [Myxococcota bacterium]
MSVVSTFDIQLEQQNAYEFLVRFDKQSFAPLHTDEPPPLGKDAGPNPARVLAAALANCLSASLVFCLSKKGEKVEGLTSTAHVEIVRNERNRLRIGKVDITIKAPLPRESEALQACLETFEDFCIVTQSVREGLEVNVTVEAHG